MDSVQRFITNNSHQLGYIMDEAAKQWAEKNPSGALTVGPCMGTIDVYGSYLELLDKIELVEKEFITIKFQEGPIHEHGVNGSQIEEVIQVLHDRLQGFQNGGFPCNENTMAMHHLKRAKKWLDERTAKRKAQGVEGKYEKHND
ncbi:hypothetical protein OCF62_07480 [Bacillus wiedmannii]|uniref:hypothetical protein n=1 Tax=Bacillus wiedmannii TaxID=1890302 RepID=UPI0021CFBA4F|nr:hypothetical protein [Bacillus wiedmannii]MCU5514411.1 hypothetical protein [Bacillus wiedmannii]